MMIRGKEEEEAEEFEFAPVGSRCRTAAAYVAGVIMRKIFHERLASTSFERAERASQATTSDKRGGGAS